MRNLLDDDNKRLEGPEQRVVDFGMRDDYVNQDILTGIISEAKMINKYKDTKRYDSPEKLEALINEYINKVADNTKDLGSLNKDIMMDEFRKELGIYEKRKELKDGGDPNEGITELRKVAPEVVERMGYQEGGEMDEIEGLPFAPEYEMEEENEMLPDEEMEQNFIDFIVDEALSEEEESMLMEQLEANPELSMVFDKVIEKASEFTGAGPVDGPGTGTSDDIPARLSDGEFVFTAKAVEQIGADNLMQMMKDAEAAYDAGGEREAMQEGGEAQLEEDDKKVEVEYSVKRPMTAEQSLLGQMQPESETDVEIKKSMMSPFGHVRS